jgi:hypothetical protein
VVHPASKPGTLSAPLGALLMKMNLSDDPKQDIQQISQRILAGWVMTLLGTFIALRLASYFGVYGMLGLLIILVPSFALYQSWKPWLRYIFFGD